MNNDFLKLMVVLWSGMLLVGCEDGDIVDGAAHNKQVAVDTVPTTMSEVTEQLVAEGLRPVLDRSDALPGMDTNMNGIRDDIDSYLNALTLSPQKISALIDLASHLQTVQMVDLSDSTNVESVSARIAQSLVCLSAAYDDPADAHAELTKLEAYTANTPERAQQYIRYNEARDGAVTRLPSFEDCQ